jgi:hypothetical protein
MLSSLGGGPILDDCKRGLVISQDGDWIQGKSVVSQCLPPPECILAGSSSSHELSFSCGLGHSGLELGGPRFSSMVAGEDIASGWLPGLDVTSIICITPALNLGVTSRVGDAQPLGSKQVPQESLECSTVVWTRPGAILA